jgi:hypothetical protein
LPESLLEKLMRLSGEKNKTRLITNALVEYDRQLRRKKLLSCQGKGIISEDFSPYKILQSIRRLRLTEYKPTKVARESIAV